MEPRVSTAAACRALGVSRATLYRRRKRRPDAGEAKSVSCPRRLGRQERQAVLDVLHSERFIDRAPGEVYATLLDEEIYLCSERTMYRVLAENKEVRERRAQRQHNNYAKPELLATRPNEIWTWDITKLKGPRKWTYYYLYVIMDIYSRFVPGWMVAERESAMLAKMLISQTCDREGIVEGELTLHSDRGPSMTSKLVAQLLADLGVTKSHSRPYVSNDNPYSEAQFKTMKYRPEFPDRFGSMQDVRTFGDPFFNWYNTEHRHSGIAMMTPAALHYGDAPEILDNRRRVLEAAYRAHPERFVQGPPKPEPLPTAAWINRPANEQEALEAERSAKCDLHTCPVGDDLGWIGGVGTPCHGLAIEPGPTSEVAVR
jgi:putative transposase